MADITRWDPFEGLTSMHSQIDDLFNNMMGANFPSASHSAPAMDVYSEDDKSLIVDVQLPGFTKDDIDVRVHNNVLEISGQKTDKSEEGKKKNYIMRESHSSFYRSISLPKRADGDQVKAHFEDGILKVTVPLAQLPEPKKVSISSGKK